MVWVFFFFCDVSNDDLTSSFRKKHIQDAPEGFVRAVVLVLVLFCSKQSNVSIFFFQELAAMPVTWKR